MRLFDWFQKKRSKPTGLRRRHGDVRELANRLHDRRGRNVTVVDGLANPRRSDFDAEHLAATANDLRWVDRTNDDHRLGDNDSNSSYVDSFKSSDS